MDHPPISMPPQARPQPRRPDGRHRRRTTPGAALRPPKVLPAVAPNPPEGAEEARPLQQAHLLLRRAQEAVAEARRLALDDPLHQAALLQLATEVERESRGVLWELMMGGSVEAD